MNDKPDMVELRVRAENFDDEHFSLGVVRSSIDQVVSYANRAAIAMMEGQLVVGQQLSALNLDDASRFVLQQALETRYELQEGSGYDLKVSLPDQGTTVRARVEAVPEYGAGGELLGSIAFILDQSVDTVASAIQDVMDMAATPQQLLNDLAGLLREVLVFDALMVTALSRNGEHLRNFFESPAAPEMPTPYRWWAMPPFVRMMVRDFAPGPLDLDALFAQSDFAELATTDPTLKDFRKRNFQHALRLRVTSKGAQVPVC